MNLIFIKSFYFFAGKIFTGRLFKNSLSFIIAFQLAVHPWTTSAAPQQDQKVAQSFEMVQKFNTDHVLSLRKFIFGGKQNKGHYKNHDLDVFSLLGQQSAQLVKRRVQHRNLIVEVIVPLKISEEDSKPAEEDSKTDEKASKAKKIETGEVKAVLSHPSQHALAPKILTPEKVELFRQSVFKHGDTAAKRSFQISHLGEILHSFPHNIQWIAFFDSYLVFLEFSKVSEEKALISFIDLNYFQKALGKTALPIFYIPVHFDENISRESLIAPHKLEITAGNELLIDSLSLSLPQMDYVSRLQQLGFNATVSLIDPANAKTSQEYLREIVTNFESSLSETHSGSRKAVDPTINLKTKEMVLKFLEHRRGIGSAKDISGKYGKLGQAEALLGTQMPEDEIVKEFKDSLTKDQAFQESVQQVHGEMIKEQQFFVRNLAFLNHLTRPQPLGAPKIKKALGLIANSILKNETVEERFLMFKEALYQLAYPNINRAFITAGVVAGAGMLASPNTANYFIMAFDAVGSWLGNWAELASVTLKSVAEGLSPLGFYEAYIKDGRISYLAIGLPALFGAFFSSVGIIHLGSNFADIALNMKNSLGEREHRKKVRGLSNRMGKLKKDFIAYMEKNRVDFVHDLANSEKKKLGILLSLNSGTGMKSRQTFKTVSNLQSFYSALEDPNKELFLQITADHKEGPPFVVSFKSEPYGQASDSLKENQISLSTRDGKIQAERVFTVSEGSMESLLDTNQTSIPKDLSLKMSLTGEDLLIEGLLESADFSPEDHERLNAIFAEIEKKSGKALISTEDSLSKGEIKTLKQAVSHLFFGYSSWAKTFRYSGIFWNGFFMGRSLIFRPEALARSVYYAKYFHVVYRHQHRASIFNGGKQSRWNRRLNTWQAHREAVARSRSNPELETPASVKQSFKAIKEFENRIIKLEKEILKEVSAQAYLEMAKQVGKQPGESSILAHGASALSNHDIKNKRLKIFHGIFTHELFTEVTKDYLLDLVDTGALKNEKSIKKQLFIKFLNGENLIPEKPDSNAIRQRVERIAKEKKIAEKTSTAIDNIIKGFLKRLAVSREQASRNALDPNKNLQTNRANVARRLLNDAEALARAARQQMADLVVDTPIGFLFSFLFLAGVDQGILKILHDQPFTEEAWFHLSRFAIWMALFYQLVFGVLAGTWWKVQQDSRLDEKQGFDNIPEKEDVNKRFGYIRWFMKQFFSKDNTLLENYKHVWRLTIANIPAALINIAILDSIFLGRFDLDVFIAMYFMTIFPYDGLQFKIENSFEKSANWALKKLIKKDLDLKGKDRRFLSHPAVQNFKTKESGKLRKKFNVWLALFLNNPMGEVLGIFQNTHTPSQGSRTFNRLFLGGKTMTEHWVNFIDFLENKEVLGSGFAESCKKIFTNNRTDI